VEEAEAGVRALTTGQISRIYDGKVVNWKEVGGNDLPIRLIDRPQESAVRMALSKALFRGKIPVSSVAVNLETSESAYHAMRSLSGYIAFAPLSRTVVEQFPCVPISVDGHLPLASNVGKGSYPARLEYGLLFPRSAPVELNEFVNYLLSTEGVHQVASLGLVPAVESLSLARCHCRATEGTFAPARRGGLAGTFTLAIVPELGAIEQEKRYAGISRAIADGMQVNIQVKHLGSYDEVVREFSEGRIDGAFVGSLVYARLHRRFGVTPVARPEAGGESRYRGVLIVGRNSPFRSAADLRGHTVAAVKNTSAGELHLRNSGGEAARDPERYFGRIVWVPSHADAVRLLAADPALSDAFRVLSTSAAFPENALAVAASLGEKQKARLREVLLGLSGTEEGRKALAQLGADRFVATSDEDYSAVYGLADRVGLDLTEVPPGRK
jgi:phosphate transport system substrate-binding protein